jgi:hypothetical protein
MSVFSPLEMLLKLYHIGTGCQTERNSFVQPNFGWPRDVQAIFETFFILFFDVAFYIEVAADKRFDLRELQVNTTLL